jgi:hypothetical protein
VRDAEPEGIRVDAGIVYARNRPYIFCAMLTCLGDQEGGPRRLQEASRLVYDYIERIGAGAEYGRQIGR